MADEPRVEPVAEDTGTSEHSPGSLLSAARKERDLEVKEIAAALNVDPWMLEALEADDFEALGAPVFAKGHLKKYAAALGLDEGDVLVEYYQREGATKAPPLIAESILRVEAARPRVEDWRWPILGTLSLGALAAAVFFYWQLRDARSAPAVEQPVVSESPAGDVGARSQRLSLPLTIDSSLARVDGAAPAQPLSVQTAAVDAPDVSTVEPGATGASEPSAPAARGGPPQPADPVRAPTLDTLDDPALDQTRRQRGATAEDRPPSDQVLVTLRFRGDSWVEVYDVDRQKLIYDMIEAGGQRTVTGNGPLQVFLGKASDVDVLINGEPFEVRRISSSGTARFYAQR